MWVELYCWALMQVSAYLACTRLDGLDYTPSFPRLAFPLALLALLPSFLLAWHPAQTVLWGTFNGTVSSLQFQIRTEIFGNASYSATCMPVYVSSGQQLLQLPLLAPGAWQQGYASSDQRSCTRMLCRGCKGNCHPRALAAMPCA